MKNKTKIKEKKDNVLQRWYRICEPSKKLWFWQILFYICYAAIYTTMAIFAAKTINALVEQNWTEAFMWLGVEFADILLRNIFLHFQYIIYSKHYGHIRKNITSKIYNKLFLSEDKSLKNLSTEKIVNIAQNNLSYAAEFPDYVAYFVRYIVQICIALVTSILIMCQKNFMKYCNILFPPLKAIKEQ